MRILQMISFFIFAGLFSATTFAYTNNAPLCPTSGEILSQDALNANVVRCDADKECVYEQLSSIAALPDTWWFFLDFPESGADSGAVALAEKELQSLKFKTGPVLISDSVTACYYVTSSGARGTALNGV
jgi:hypothetical protein